MTGRKLVIWALRLALVAVIVGGWLFANGPGGVSPLLLPKLDLVLQQFGELVTTSTLRSDLLVTLMEIAGGLAIAMFLGTLIGFWGARSTLRAKVVEPLVTWGYLAPLVLFYPIFILWFGIGPSSKIGYAAVNALFPIAYNSLRAFQNVDPRYLRVAHAFGASRIQTDWLVKWRAALPMVMSGIRIGAATSMITVILAEMLSASRGLGYLLAKSSQTFAVSQSFAVILIVLVVVVVLQFVINRAFTVDRPRRRRAG